MLYQLSYSRSEGLGVEPKEGEGGGGWWIRTTVGIRRRVYSPFPLAALAIPQSTLFQSFRIPETNTVREHRPEELAVGLEPATGGLQNRCSAD
jgi:hypothetical protein